jgi:hypothetical protein
MDDFDVHDPNVVIDAFNNTTDELYFHLVRAEYHARKAHDLLYKENAPRRSIWYRMSVSRAQSLLMTLWIREMNRRNKS